MSQKDIAQWIDNDEGLYNWWKQSRQSKRKFIQENQKELSECINKVLNGTKQAHYLVYG
jgi:transposase-like protein